MPRAPPGKRELLGKPRSGRGLSPTQPRRPESTLPHLPSRAPSPCPRGRSPAWPQALPPVPSAQPSLAAWPPLCTLQPVRAASAPALHAVPPWLPRTLKTKAQPSAWPLKLGRFPLIPPRQLHRSPLPALISESDHQALLSPLPRPPSPPAPLSPFSLRHPHPTPWSLVEDGGAPARSALSGGVAPSPISCLAPWLLFASQIVTCSWAWKEYSFPSLGSHIATEVYRAVLYAELLKCMRLILVF